MSPAKDIVGSIATTRIEEGAVILWNQIRAKPDNFDGDSVTLSYKSGSLQIKTKGKLMSDAFIGDSVKVISEATNSVLTGTLGEMSVVEIQRGKE
jgi:flagella basal body P-ring formation protein FlgA